ncbi:MAG: hypothetical protein OXG37_01260 [Actinomycetia bacterium]|nr:hypothetical protein [Actinomycetes bacterium]
MEGLANNIEYTFRIRALAGTGIRPASDAVTQSVNSPASFPSDNINAAENQTAVDDLMASDPDSADSITGYEITGARTRIGSASPPAVN